MSINKLWMYLLIMVCFVANTAFAALPKEGTYEKRSSNGAVEARMYVMAAGRDSAYTTSLGNENAEIIWVESYLEDGRIWSQFATTYIWKRDDVGAAETALILDREESYCLEDNIPANPRYARDMGSFSFRDNGTATVYVQKQFAGVPSSWDLADVSSTFNGEYKFISPRVRFSPLVVAYANEKTAKPERFNDANVNQDWNQARIRIEKAKDGHYNIFENMMEMGHLIVMKARVGNDIALVGETGRGVLIGTEVRFRRTPFINDNNVLGFLNMDENVKVHGLVEGYDGQNWYYFTRANGQNGFAAAQFIDLR